MKNTAVADSLVLKFCNSCSGIKPINEFYSNARYAGGKKHPCSNCKACVIARIARVTKARRLKLIELGGGKCKNCGYSRCIEALEFHHRDRSKKDLQINKIRSITKKVLVELEKCDLLCATCHREAHYLA